MGTIRLSVIRKTRRLTGREMEAQAIIGRRCAEPACTGYVTTLVTWRDPLDEFMCEENYFCTEHADLSKKSKGPGEGQPKEIA